MPSRTFACYKDITALVGAVSDHEPRCEHGHQQHEPGRLHQRCDNADSVSELQDKGQASKEGQQISGNTLRMTSYGHAISSCRMHILLEAIVGSAKKRGGLTSQCTPGNLLCPYDCLICINEAQSRTRDVTCSAEW